MKETQDFDSATAEKIAAARSLRHLGPRDYLTPWRNIAECLRERERERGAQPFLIFYGDGGERREFSYTVFGAEVRRAAAALHEDLGLGRGDRLAVLAHNHCDTVVQYFAAWLLGAAVVPINMGEDDERIRFVLQNAECKAAVVRSEYAERAAGIFDGVAGLRKFAALGGLGPSCFLSWESLMQGKPGDYEPPEAASLDDEALIVYTSGTTGAPKGVVLEQYNLFADAYGIARWHGFSRDSRLMCVLPIHHVNGIVVTLFTPFYAGGSVVLNRKFQTAGFWQRIAEEKVNVVSVVPTLLEFLYEAGERHKDLDLRAFRHVICGAGPLTVDLALRFEQRFGFPIVHGYGLSETTCYSCFLPLDLTGEERRRWHSEHGFPSIGAAIEVNEMDIHDPEGRSVPGGRRGEIVIRGHNVMRGYFKRPEANAETFAHGWFRSGDEGFALTDARGRRFFFITGRLKELIIRGGVNISPFEIDEVLRRIPGVRAAVAVGFDNKYYGEEVGAYVRLEDGVKLDEAAVIAACRRELPFSKSPKVVVFGDDIPVTSTGKYQRNRLKPFFEAWRGHQFREK